MSTEFKNYCHKHGIKQELTQASTPHQNGISERRNRTIIERARSLCHECNLPTFLWIEAPGRSLRYEVQNHVRPNFATPMLYAKNYAKFHKKIVQL
jgi:hypothetical protein